VLAIAIPLADLLPRSPGPYVALMLTGFGIGILGHLTRARVLVAAGIILIFLGALAFPLIATLGSGESTTPIEQSHGDAGE
jgi:hypothetical protein